MTPQEFEKEMQLARDEYDNDEECMHGVMDSIMCECLCALGYERGVQIFEDAPKWYA